MIRKTGTKAPRRRGKAKPNGAIEQSLAELEQLAPKSAKARNVIAMFQDWLRDESGYDEQAWPKLMKALDQERTRIGARRLFDA
jgi:hypothetical protein